MDNNISLIPLIPPFRFSFVQSNLSRGAYPTLHNYRYLRRLKLKTIISIIPEKPIEDLIEFCKCESITLHYFNIEKYNQDNLNFPTKEIANILYIILQKNNLPLYIHCLDGSNNTGLVIAILRKLQNWNKQAIINEFCRFIRNESIDKEELEYIANYNDEIIMPEYSQLPEWVWQNNIITKHPTLKLKFPLQPETPSNIFNKKINDPLMHSPLVMPEWEKEKEKIAIRKLNKEKQNIIDNHNYELNNPEIIKHIKFLNALDLAGI